jgi:hypothetical protein
MGKEAWDRDGPGAREVLGVELVGFALTAIDEPQLPGVSDQNLVATLFLRANDSPREGEWVPTSMATLREYSESKRCLRASGVLRSLPSSMTSPLCRHRSGTDGCIFVTEIQPGCNLWLLPATIRHGPLPPSVEPIWSSYIFADPHTQGTARGIGLLISSSEYTRLTNVAEDPFCNVGE